jgi:hypothetical protein
MAGPDQAIERLNGGLFIHTEESCVLRRIHVQTDDVGGLLLELRIVADHVALQLMRSQSSLQRGYVARSTC